MQGNGWLRLALFSFIGLIISITLLSMLSPGSMYGGNYAMQGHQGGQQMQQSQAMGSNMGSMNSGMGMPMNNMSTQGGSSGMGMMGTMGNNAPMNSMAPMGSGMQGGNVTINDMAQQMYMMQMQLNQMQNMIYMMMNNNAGGSMSGGGSSGGGSMSGGGGGMGMM